MQFCNSAIFLQRIAEYHDAVGVELHEFFQTPVVVGKPNLNPAVRNFVAGHTLLERPPQPRVGEPLTQGSITSRAVRQDHVYEDARTIVRQASTEVLVQRRRAK